MGGRNLQQQQLRLQPLRLVALRRLAAHLDFNRVLNFKFNRDLNYGP